MEVFYKPKEISRNHIQARTKGEAKGRFAPSPSGRMHFGNVYAALLSWLSIKKMGGSWVLRIEDLVESALTGVTGYFDIQNNSYIKQMQQVNDRILKENSATARYQEILENKFSSMDLLISQLQQQYSSFLIA